MADQVPAAGEVRFSDLGRVHGARAGGQVFAGDYVMDGQFTPQIDLPDEDLRKGVIGVLRGTAPSRVTDLSVSGDDDTATLTFGASNASFVRIEWPGGAAVVPAAARSFTIPSMSAWERRSVVVKPVTQRNTVAENTLLQQVSTVSARPTAPVSVAPTLVNDTTVRLDWLDGAFSNAVVSWTGPTTGSVTIADTAKSLTVTGLASNAQYTFTFTPYNAANQAGTPWGVRASTGPFGEALFTTPGETNWTVPAGVSSIHAVCIGGGGGGGNGTPSGSGGGLGWMNGISVVPGQTITVRVGAGSTYMNAATSTNESFVMRGATTFLRAQAGGTAGAVGGNFVLGTGFTYSNGGGGRGGSVTYSSPNGGTYQMGGCGAGGYAGDGGYGSYPSSTGSLMPGTAGTGGGGGGGGLQRGGGGTSVYGLGASGALGGFGGSFGGNSTSSGSGQYGGGGSAFDGGTGTGHGAQGAVRIVWGAGRSFPGRGVGRMTVTSVTTTSAVVAWTGMLASDRAVVAWSNVGGGRTDPLGSGTYTYTASNLRPNWVYQFTVTPLDTNGVQQPALSAPTINTLPAAVSDAAATVLFSNALQASWRPVAHDRVRLAWSTSNSGFIPAATSNFTASNMAPNAFHAFTITPFNASGSAGAAVVVSNCTLAAPPTSVTADGPTLTALMARWTGGAYSNVRLGWADDRGWGASNTTFLIGSGTSNFRVPGLSNNTGYTFNVTPFNLAGVAGAEARSADAVDTLPVQVASVAAGSASATGMLVTWMGGAYSNARVSWTGGSSGTSSFFGPSTTSFQATGLVANSAYTFTVTPFNRQLVAGAGVSAATAHTLPTTVTSVTAGTATLSSLVVSWAGGSYAKVIVSWAGNVSGSSPFVAAGTTTYTVTGLTAYSPYTFTVTPYNAVNDAGTAVTSAAFQTLPTQVTSVTTSGATSTQIAVSWSGGSYSKVIVSWTGGSSGNSGYLTGATSYTATGLAANSSYTFTVTPYNDQNAAGTGVSAALAYTLPSQITSINPQVSSTLTSVTISWSGGSYSKVLVTWTGSQSGSSVTYVTGTSYTASGLPSYGTFTFTVTPYNAADQAGPSTTASTTSRSRPTSFVDLTLSKVNSTTYYLYRNGAMTGWSGVSVRYVDTTNMTSSAYFGGAVAGTSIRLSFTTVEAGSQPNFLTFTNNTGTSFYSLPQTISDKGSTFTVTDGLFILNGDTVGAGLTLNGFLRVGI